MLAMPTVRLLRSVSGADEEFVEDPDALMDCDKLQSTKRRTTHNRTSDEPVLEKCSNNMLYVMKKCCICHYGVFLIYQQITEVTQTLGPCLCCG